MYIFHKKDRAISDPAIEFRLFNLSRVLQIAFFLTDAGSSPHYDWLFFGSGPLKELSDFNVTTSLRAGQGSFPEFIFRAHVSAVANK